MTYEIYEGNMEKLRAKLARIEKKCAKYGNVFKFEEVGEVFHEMKDEDGKEFSVRYVVCDVEGVAKVNGWKFAGTLEHTEKGNVVRAVCDGVEVPERYYHCAPKCEHCKTNRVRKDTYLVLNEETGEWKQVGKNCLMDFTNGLNAEWAAAIEQYIHEVEEAHESYGLGGWIRYYHVGEMMSYWAETVQKYGYVSRQANGESTADRGFRYWKYDHGQIRMPKLEAMTEREIAEVGFNAKNGEELANAVIAWAAGQDKDGSYFHNLKVLCSAEYCNGRDFGILASAVIAYQKEMKIVAERKAREDVLKNKREQSGYVGEVGKRVDFEVVAGRCVTSFETMYGTTWLYEFSDVNGNVLIWYASGAVDDEKVKFPCKVRGTVKDHKEYNGVKQTVLTRCKVG